MRPYPEEPSNFWTLRWRPCEPWENALSLIFLKTSACQVSNFYTGPDSPGRIYSLISNRFVVQTAPPAQDFSRRGSVPRGTFSGESKKQNSNFQHRERSGD